MPRPRSSLALRLQISQEAWEFGLPKLGWAKTYDAEFIALDCLFNCPLLTRIADSSAGLPAGGDHRPNAAMSESQEKFRSSSAKFE